MDAKVDDFFNEINQIAPPKEDRKEKDDWEECFDEQSGYTYYWNVRTNEVTWDTPPEYKSKTTKKSRSHKKSAPPLPSYLSHRPKTVPTHKERRFTKRKHSTKKYIKHNSESEDEKIEIITSYGSESDTEQEKKHSSNTPSKAVEDSYVSDEDDGDILQKIQKRVQELKEESKTKDLQSINLPNENSVPPESVAPSQSGISLIAGYSDSEEENEESSTLPAKPEVVPVSHSTLFPITKPVDIRDFTTDDASVVEAKENKEFDNKAFKRKRRIGIALVNTAKKKDDTEHLDTERKGLGFGKDSPTSNIKDNVYQNFTKGGVMFIKADVLNPVPSKNENIDEDVEAVINRNDINDMYSTLKEKLTFLNVGKLEISPVQVMLIQAEMLFVAMNEGGLKLSYLQKWLSETCSELVKLEKEATPEGWQLQWDRQHKRYFYRNEVSGTSQWEYPTGPAASYCEESGSDSDAMDISTTPPPSGPFISESPPPPPSPPKITCPTPPPPPAIGEPEHDNETTNVVNDKGPAVPVETVPVKKISGIAEPLPPGVDSHELASNKEESKTSNASDPLFSALDSFYSDIAAISSNTSSTTPPIEPPPVPENCDKIANSIEPARKKKKTKVKLAAGLAMKKKGVIQLVEKWKNVQQDYQE